MMLGRKFFKTKLCKLYLGGRCPRENCSFAHGNSELRHAPPPFNDRRDYRSADLRDKLYKRHSPHRRYSPGGDARGSPDFHKPISRDRGYSVSRSPVRRSERRHRKKQHLDGESNDSGSLKVPNAEQRKMEKVSSQDEKDVIEEQLKKMQLEIEMLDDHKSQLEMLLEEKDDEAHKFSSRIEALEMQLNKEQEHCKSITSKVIKFVRAHERYLKAQEEYKRSQARLQRLGDLLGSDTSKLNGNGEDSSMNITSDGEHNGDKQRSPKNDDLQNNFSIKKRQYVYGATSEEAQIRILQKKKKISGIIFNNETEAKTVVHAKKEVKKSVGDEYRNKRGKISPPVVASLDKVKGSDTGRLLPSTSMAAHALDEFSEAIEKEEKYDSVGATVVNEIGAVGNRAGLSYMPPQPPPAAQNAYRQYEGDDEDVEVEKVDTEMLDIDLNSEVDIEQL